VCQAGGSESVNDGDVEGAKKSLAFSLNKEYSEFMKTKTTLTIRLSESQLQTLREIALEEDRSLSNVIRRFIDECTKTRKFNADKTERKPQV